MDAGAEKLKYFEDKTQLVLFDDTGIVKESCDTLVDLSSESSSLFDIEPFLEGIKDVLFGLGNDEEVNFPCIGQELLGRKGYFDLQFKKIKHNGENIFHWIIIDLTEYYKFLIPIQQERNELDIRSEFLEIQQKAITLEKKLLEFQNNELKRQKKFKEEFFAQVSHEMRTPLNSMKGLVNLLKGHIQEKSTDQKTFEYLDDLMDTSNHLSAIVNDVLDLSMVESGEIKIENQWFSLRDMVKSIANSFSYAVNEKGLDLIYQIEVDAPDLLLGDRQKLTQILYNVIGNSVKYTTEGAIEINISRGSGKGEEINILFTVKDSGMGMSDYELGKIFDPYTRSETVKNESYEGTGLGMNIVQKLIKLMGGEITISSAKDEGTKVDFSLPFNKGEEESYLVESDRDQSSDHHEFQFIQKVIVVEDDPLASKIMAESLRLLSFDVKCFSSGEQALEEIRTVYYDLLIIDNQLPGITGLELAKTVRNADSYNKDLPALIITGELMPSIPPYISGFLLKPYSINHLASTIKEIDDLLVDSKFVNLRYLREVTNNNDEVINELVQIFCRDMPINITAMRKMAVDGKQDLLKKNLHKTIPNIQYMGISGLERLMELLETEIINGVSDIDYDSRFNEIEELCEKGIRMLKKLFPAA